MKTITRKVAAALMLDRVSIRYLVEFNPDEAIEFLQHAEGYNEYTPDILVNLVKKINELIPPMKFPDPDNPNNGKLHHKFIIGNEGTRVIYLKISKFYLDEQFQGKKFDYKELEDRLAMLAKDAKASEYSTEVNNGAEFRYRIWWD